MGELLLLLPAGGVLCPLLKLFLVTGLSTRVTGLSCRNTAYEKKYGTEEEREARREAQARARVKAMAERESLQRDEEKQLMEVIKASLQEASAVDLNCLMGVSL